MKAGSMADIPSKHHDTARANRLLAALPGDAYERLLHDAMAGDQTLFLRQDAVERSWEIVAPVLDASGTVHPYAAGTWGPSAADELIAPRVWRPS